MRRRLSLAPSQRERQFMAPIVTHLARHEPDRPRRFRPSSMHGLSTMSRHASSPKAAQLLTTVAASSCVLSVSCGNSAASASRAPAVETMAQQFRLLPKASSPRAQQVCRLTGQAFDRSTAHSAGIPPCSRTSSRNRPSI
jgi:hypothetical protein